MNGHESGMACELFSVTLLCFLLFGSSAGFLIVLSQRRLCLLFQNNLIILGRCDVTNPTQHWDWLDGARLIHTESSRCLWADPSPRLPDHARLVKLSDCSKAPGWSCHDRAFGLAGTQMYLKKQGSRLVIRGNAQTSEWTKYDVDSGGSLLMGSLCPETGEGEQDR